MNPRQRRAILLLALAAAGLLGVFVLVANYVGDVETEVGDKIVVLELKSPVKANDAINDEDVTEKVVPRRWAPRAALTDRTQLVGYVAASDLQPNSILQEGMLETPPQIKQGQREVAILVDASTGVAGRITPGSHVDVIASYGGEDAKPGTTPKPNRSIVIVPGAQVLAVGTPRLKGANGAQEAPQNPSEVVPVTFALNKTQELKVAHAQTFAADLRLALLPEGDPGDRTLPETIYRGEDPKKGDDDGAIK
jgi:pilus assembly protein CpaB